ncbi:probable cytochrome P450 28d1 [Leptidea sinapis]|uniref:probable cytochrome P450 28d1 n=1 Tax=Leptidea sinapis TaxID=189913 RepID=UPI002139FE5E|nr:probable cytochrome P450 28d1 [Leptidea sinapis]
MFFESFLLNLLILLILIIALLFDYVTKYFSYWYIRHIPNKTPIPCFGTDYHRIIGFRSTSQEVDTLYKQYSEKFVGCIKSRIPDLIVKDPDVVRKILSTDFLNFHSRGLGLDKSRDVCLRNNLFYVEGEKWTLLRDTLETLLNNMKFETQEGLHDCLSGINGDTNIQQLLCMILDIVFKDLLIGNDVEECIITHLRQRAIKRSFKDKAKTYLKNIFPSLFVLFNLESSLTTECLKVRNINETKLYKGFKKAKSISQLDSKSIKVRAENEIELGVLSLFITEGYIPCYNVLTALLYELAKHPEIQERARNNENNLNLAIKETLRLYSPYANITRKCIGRYLASKDLLIDKGVMITIPTSSMQKDETLFNDPESFKPERFEKTDAVDGFYPFGMGPKKCVGENLAMSLINGVAAAILQKFSIEVCDATVTELQMVDHDFMRILDSNVWLRFKPLNTNHS